MTYKSSLENYFHVLDLHKLDRSMNIDSWISGKELCRHIIYWCMKGRQVNDFISLSIEEKNDIELIIYD
jgi:hypothetical protein